MQESKKQITTNVNRCGQSAIFNEEITADELAKFPMIMNIPAGERQRIKFNKCFLPEFSKICGIKSLYKIFKYFVKKILKIANIL